MERTEAQRSEPDPRQLLFRKGARELERRCDARHLPQRREDGDRLVAEASESDLEHCGRRRVEPLDVVERNEHGVLLRQHADRVEESQADEARVGRRVARLHEEERDLEGAQPERCE